MERSVKVAFVDQGYAGEGPARAAQEHEITMEVVKRPEAKRGKASPLAGGARPADAAVPALGGRTHLRLDHPLPVPRAL
jgi:hypothetical protein